MKLLMTTGKGIGFIFIFFTLHGFKNKLVAPVQLEALTPQSIKGEFLPRRSANGHVINIGEFIYQNGIGTTAPSELTYKIPRGYQRFEAWVGFDITSGKGNAVFEVLVDGKVKFSSGARSYLPFSRSPESNPDRPMKVSVLVKGGTTLTLKATTEEGSGKLLINWGNAAFCPLNWPEYAPRKKVEGLSATPPMGWNPWNWNGSGIHQDTLKQIADAMVSKGFLKAGYQYMNLDGGWAERNKDTGRIGYPHPREKMFPDGIEAYADYIHAKGLKFGIYANMQMVGRQPKKEGMWDGGYENEFAESFAKWGVDYLKYDFSTREGNYFMLRAIKKAGRPIFYNACAWGHEVDWNWAYFMGANSIRSTYDVNNIWQHGNDKNPVGIIDAIDQAEAIGRFTGSGFWNDPDMLVVGLTTGTVGQQVKEFPLANKIEQRTQFSLYCMLASSLIMGCDLRNIDDYSLETLLNKEVIAIDQDPLGVSAWRVVKLDAIEIWKRPLDNGDWAIAILNRGDKAMDIKADWEDMNVFGQFNIRDLWQHKNLGAFNKELVLNVASHETKVLRFSKVK